MSAYETILFDVDDGVGTLTMNRPDRMNGMTVQMLHEAYDCLSAAARDNSIRIIQLTGAGQHFCPGADIGVRAGDTSAEDQKRDQTPFQIATALHEMPQVTVAAINGAAAGAGLGWALACDLRFAASSAMFNVAFLNVGVAGDMGGPWFLPRILGAAKARELCFMPEKFPAAEAERIGMVAKVYSDESFRGEMERILTTLRKKAPLALRGLKANFLAAERMDLRDYIALETERHTDLLATADSKEAFRAFLEKRDPVFEGR